MESDPKLLEEEGYSFLYQEKFEEAFRLFKKAADIYKNRGNHKQASLCFASAASCWSIKSGEETFYNAAQSYENAAGEAQISGDFEYASLLYKYAAINYERDGEYLYFSECFYRSKENYRKFLFYLLLNPKKLHPIIRSAEKKGIKNFIKHIFLWLAFTVSYLLWGYGERPSRTVSLGIFFISFSAIFYSLAGLVQNNIFFRPNFFEAFYFSVITFTTVGYGDVIPYGASRIMVMVESLSSILIMPIFMVGLSRKYLRI